MTTKNDLHPISQKILADFQPRKTKAQKQAFIDWLIPALAKEGIEMRIESQGWIFKSNNLIVGSPDDCEFVLGAHYDTAPVLPFPNFIIPRNLLLTLLIQMVMMFFPLLLWWGLVAGISSLMPNNSEFITKFFRLSLPILYLVMIFFGPTNKHTANDNTSGIITMIETMLAMDTEYRERVCFVLFDLEEVGMVGSSAFRQKHTSVMKDKILINLDCVSDGDHLMLVMNRPASKTPHFRENIQSSFEKALENTSGKTFQIDPAWRSIYPSDQMGFRKSLAIAALKKAPIIGLYLDRIHTRHDVIFDVENIRIISQAMLAYTKSLAPVNTSINET